MKIKYLLLIAILIASICIPASATLIAYPKGSNALWNNSGNLYEYDAFSESGFVPDNYVWYAIGLGAVFTLASIWAQRKVIASLIAPIFWAWATWYSIYMYTDTISATGTASNSTVTIVQIVNAVGTLQIALLGVTVITVLYAAYVLFFDKTDTKSSGPIKPPE
jgi:hypothetical protein